MQKAIATQCLCSHSQQHDDAVMEEKKEGLEMCFLHMELPFSLGSRASTEFWDISKCPTIQPKTDLQSVQTTSLTVERAGEGKENSPISTQGYELACLWL